MAGSKNSSSAETPTGESLEQVRDLLFGAQMRTVDDRLAQMEKRFQASLADLGKQLERFEKAATKRSDALDDKIKAERTKRTEDARALEKDMRAGFKDLGDSVAKLEEATSKSDAELRDQILQAVEALSKQVSDLSDRLGGDLKKAAGDLQHAKADRAVIAEMFSAFADRLGDKPKTSKGKKG